MLPVFILQYHEKTSPKRFQRILINQGNNDKKT